MQSVRGGKAHVHVCEWWPPSHLRIHTCQRTQMQQAKLCESNFARPYPPLLPGPATCLCRHLLVEDALELPFCQLQARAEISKDSSRARCDQRRAKRAKTQVCRKRRLDSVTDRAGQVVGLMHPGLERQVLEKRPGLDMQDRSDDARQRTNPQLTSIGQHGKCRVYQYAAHRGPAKPNSRFVAIAAYTAETVAGTHSKCRRS